MRMSFWDGEVLEKCIFTGHIAIHVKSPGISPLLTPKMSRMPDFIGRDEFLEVK